MFPFGVYGFIRIKELANAYAARDKAAKRIARMLAWHNAKASREDNTVRFGIGMRYAYGGNDILVPFEKGTIRVEQEGNSLKVSYSLSTVRMARIVAAMALVFGGLAASKGFDAGARVFLEAFLWLYGGNYVLGAIRIPIWLHRVLRDLGKSHPGGDLDPQQIQHLGERG